MKSSILWLCIIVAVIGAGLYLVYAPMPVPQGAHETQVTFYC